MQKLQKILGECILLQPKKYEDDRGYFFESYSLNKYRFLDFEFVQDNISVSKKNTLRGIHFQNKNPQGKLVQVISGEVFDVVVDLRESSPNFLKWEGVLLSSIKSQQLFIPPGFGHGFLVTSETAIFHYKCTSHYEPNHQISINYLDPQINISWPKENKFFLSEKDRNAPFLKDILHTLW